MSNVLHYVRRERRDAVLGQVARVADRRHASDRVQSLAIARALTALAHGKSAGHAIREGCDVVRGKWLAKRCGGAA